MKLRSLALLGFLAACIGVAGFSRAAALRAAPADPEAEFELPAVPANVARPLAFGFRTLAADLTFLEAIQVYGGRTPEESEPEARSRDRLMAQLLEYTTDMEPEFAGAYRFAASALPRNSTDGHAYNVFATREILRKGMQARPDDWHIPFLLGFVDSFYLGNMTEAAEAMAHAAKDRGAPAYVGFLATRLAADAGAVDIGEKLAAAMELQATEEKTRKEWHERMLDLRMERQLRELEAAAREFHARTGRWPGSPRALVAAGLIPAVPAEPHGGRYELLPDGTAKSTAAERLRVRGRYGTQSGLIPQ